MCACVPVLLTEAAELTDDVGQGDVSHTLQLVLDVSWQHRVAQVPGLDGALHQRHPSAAMPLPTRVRCSKETGQTRERRGAEKKTCKFHSSKTDKIVFTHCFAINHGIRVKRKCRVGI